MNGTQVKSDVIRAAIRSNMDHFLLVKNLTKYCVQPDLPPKQERDKINRINIIKQE